MSRPKRTLDRWEFRRRWFARFAVVGILCLLGSLASDAFLGTNITANVFEPVCIMLGVNLVGYIYMRNQDTSNVDNSSQPPN